MSRTIWTYWETPRGRVKPPYLDLCLETMRRHAPARRVVVLDPVNVYEHLPDLRDDVFRLRRISHRTDYLRARVVHAHGGMWLDADTILLREPDLDAAAETYGFAACSREYGKPSAGFFAAPKGSPILADWVARMDAVLDAARRNPLSLFRGYRLKWTALNTLAWDAVSGRDYHDIPFARIVPIDWPDWERFFRTDVSVHDVVQGDTIAVTLFNKFMQARLERTTREEILASPDLLGQLFRHSLGGS